MTVSPYSSEFLSFSPNAGVSDNTNVELTIYPFRHEYAQKTLMFNVILNQLEPGDINMDGMVNVIDVVLTVNIILGNTSDPSADINGDGVVNVIDIVLLVNMILGN